MANHLLNSFKHVFLSTLITLLFDVCVHACVSEWVNACYQIVFCSVRFHFLEASFFETLILLQIHFVNAFQIQCFNHIKSIAKLCQYWKKIFSYSFWNKISTCWGFSSVFYATIAFFLLVIAEKMSFSCKKAQDLRS